MKNKSAWKKISILLITVIFAASMLLAGCQKEDNVIRLTYQTWTESYIIGHITQQLIEENTDYEVKTIELDSNAITWQAFKNDEVDIWGGYTSSFFVLFEDDDTVLYEPDEIYGYVSGKLEDEHGLVMLERMGFYNNYDLAVTPEAAEQYNLETYSDLAAVSGELKIAADVNFRDREDCYPLLQKEYNMDFKEVFQMAVNAKYEAVKNGEAEVISCYTTDAGVARLGLKLLKDDKHVMPHFDATYVVQKDILEKYPDLEDLLNKVKITNDEMAQMNYKVEEEDMDPKDVAREYLEEKGLI
jgi:glycine betaine/choline ABC-type transport system substrate-binding protein